MRYRKLYKQIAPCLEMGDFFINLGANDGITNDPFYDFIGPFALNGIGVEPVKTAFDKLFLTYSKFPEQQLHCECVAIYAGVVEPIYQLRDEWLTLAPVLSQVSSRDKGQLLKELRAFQQGTVDPSLYEKIHPGLIGKEQSLEDMLSVDHSMCYMTFEELLSKHAVQRVDVLNMDIEGYDFDVFMDIDLKSITPKVIIIETRLFTDVQLAAFLDRIRTYGYRFLQRFDYYSEVFVRSPIG